jgi:polyhydroxyalkanoate synthesis repressor PhaR
VIIVKKYSNRRLYDTDESRYVTLDELATKIRNGADVRVVDASSGADLTQATLAQIIIESRGAARLLPVPLLTQLIRMGDDALAEFFGHYMSGALELYTQTRRAARRAATIYPFNVSLSPNNPFVRMFSGMAGSGFGFPPRQPEFVAPAQSSEPPPPEPPPEEPPRTDEIAELRKEMEELKALLKQKVD